MKQKPTDLHQDLVKKCKTGNRLAQYKIYQLYANAMYNVCLRIINDEEMARDLLQEGFLKAFNHIKSFRGESTFGAWLKKIMINECLSELKKSKINFIRMEEEMEKIIAEPDPIELDYAKLEAEKVKRAIKKLPDGYRIVLNLYLLEGYDHEEIAQILDVSVSTSKTQYIRAKKKIKEILTSEVYHG